MSLLHYIHRNSLHHNIYTFTASRTSLSVQRRRAPRSINTYQTHNTLTKMDWIKDKIKSSTTTSLHTTTTQSISTSDAATQLHLKPQLDNIQNSCYVCEQPCEHPIYPTALVNKIDTDDMSHSIKSYQHHIVICLGQSYNRWPEKIEKSNPYIAAVSQYIKSINADDSIRINVTDRSTVIDNVEHSVNDITSAADVYLYPDMIQFHALTIEDLKYVIDQYIINGKSIQYIKQKHNATSTDAYQPELRDSIRYTPISHTDILVCAHKLRDKRCGVMGDLLIKSLQQSATQHNVSQQVRVLATSHVGGHKYAGNVIVYPIGQWLGRITPCQSDSIIQAYVTHDQTQQQLLQPWSRGKIDLQW